jgi:protein-L-isoaspartate(D-aspartate) O-methyltransferase
MLQSTELRTDNEDVKRICCLLVAALIAGAQGYDVQRTAMVRDQMAARGIKNPAVLRAMRETPRELFMPPGVRAFAYEDHAVPIGHGQTISQPYIVAFMTEMLDITKAHRVLEIGTGSGYQAAILSSLAKEVYTIEILAQLAQSASAVLNQLGYRNIMVRQGNGYNGWPDKAPFDRILLTAAPPELPVTLIDQLKPGGKLLAPIGDPSAVQELRVVEKTADGKVTSRPVLPVRFVPMINAKER